MQETEHGLEKRGLSAPRGSENDTDLGMLKRGGYAMQNCGLTVFDGDVVNLGYWVHNCHVGIRFL
jgi:hypothetical protein